MMTIIELKNVVKMYDNGKRAINGINLAIEDSENALIVGAAGSGKTTLMKLIAGIEAPSDGSVIVDGMLVHEMNSDAAAVFRNRIFGILPRHHGFMDSLTILENTAMPLAARKIPTAKRNKATSESLESLGIGHLMNAYPPQLSVMELQIASLARAIVTAPKILLIDEMEADLTAKEFKQIAVMVNAMLKFGKLTLIHFTEKENGDLPYDKRFHLEYGQLTED